MTVRPDSEVIETCLTRAREARVLVVGDVMLDRYLDGSVDRVSPEAPVPVVRAGRTKNAPGGAANVAAGLRALGSRVGLVGVLGDDAAGRALKAGLERRGVEAAGLVVEPRRPTTTKLRVVADHQQLLRIDREDDRPVDAGTADALAERSLEALRRADLLVLQDYDKGALAPDLIGRLMEAAGDRRVPVVVDPKLRHFFGYGGATVFKPNLRELGTALGQEGPSLEAEALGDVAERVGCRHLLVTLGARGLVLLEEGATETLRIPSRARDVYDVSGAGDTVTAVLAAALAGGARVRDAAWLANVAAGLAVATFGARPVAVESLLAAVRAESDDGASGNHAAASGRET